MSTHVKNLFDLEGKTALITGGSRGLGLQMAHALGEAGARIMLSSRKAEDLEQAAQRAAAGITDDVIAGDDISDLSVSAAPDVLGGIAVAAGVVLVWVRSRLRETPPGGAQSSTEKQP